jgi:plastocyanin
MLYPRRSAAICLALLTILLALPLAACGGQLPPERLIELTVTAAGYEPEQLEARVGEMVVIRFRNRDVVAHNLNLELPSGTRTIAAEDGVDAVLSFPARTAGSFRFFCSVPGHTEEGVLVIRDE